MTELREQGMNLAAMMGLMIEEMRQDHRQRVVRLDSGIIDVAHASLFEIVS